MEGGQRQFRTLNGHLHTDVGLLRILPLQTGIIDGLLGMRIVSADRGIVGSGGSLENFYVIVRGRRIQHLEGRQLDALSPAGM